MSASGPPLRTFSFGTVESGHWGAGWFPGTGDGGLVVVTIGAGTRAGPAELEAGSGAEGEWRVRGAGLELTLGPAGEAVALTGEDPGPSGFEQAALATGADLDVPGHRAVRSWSERLDRVDSVRELAAWFGPDGSVALVALRPRRQKGHEHDIVSAALLDEPDAPSISDPRLSTTYTAHGRPTRVNLELYSDDPEQFPRRVAGEVAGTEVELTGGGWSLRAELMRCHTRGHEGSGVYLLTRRI